MWKNSRNLRDSGFSTLISDSQVDYCTGGMHLIIHQTIVLLERCISYTVKICIGGMHLFSILMP